MLVFVERGSISRASVGLENGNLYLDTSDDSFIVGTPVVALNQLETGRSEVVHWNKIRFNLNTSNVAQ